jgi:hypothetical protein
MPPHTPQILRGECAASQTLPRRGRFRVLPHCLNEWYRVGLEAATARQCCFYLSNSSIGDCWNDGTYDNQRFHLPDPSTGVVAQLRPSTELGKIRLRQRRMPEYELTLRLAPTNPTLGGVGETLSSPTFGGRGGSPPGTSGFPNHQPKQPKSSDIS